MRARLLRLVFNRNFHIEPTNICIHNCRFCSYSRKFNQPGSWEMSMDDILLEIHKFKDRSATEVHIVGGVHPNRGLDYYESMLRQIREINPSLYIKAFTAVELEFMFSKSQVSVEEGLIRLKSAGLDSIPGGGAEIFDEEVRSKICPDKTASETWLAIHESAHRIGIPTNATMLYGHLEKHEHRIDHLNRLRQLQDRTAGFQVFIPLKYRKANNSLGVIGEVSSIEDLRNYAVSRIFLDNFPHLKSYWPMIGKEIAGLSLSFGVDDLDGTIEDTTRIYSMAGAGDQNPAMSTAGLVSLIRSSGLEPVERDTLYNTLKIY
ncbi:MAG: CofH family radical SAM protein [Bacteroidia bacterium]|nr:CofH family radical SAM protein [Bacteroidia bacterium]